jgi:hypothetical protein
MSSGVLKFGGIIVPSALLRSVFVFTMFLNEVSVVLLPMPHALSHCVSIFFSWDTFNLYTVNAVKCVGIFLGKPALYQVCSVDVMSALWTCLCPTLGIGVCVCCYLV